MTEKRFTIHNRGLQGQFIKESGEFLTVDMACEMLNDFYEENEQLKREKERYKRLSEIRDENINNRILSLKEFINNCEDEKVKNILEDFFYSEVNEYDLAKENRELKNENEQLKEELKIYRRIANCDNCHYHNYDWYDDGDEFEVCEKGNDMSNRICKYWREL